jgi:hypothetical protein
MAAALAMAACGRGAEPVAAPAPTAAQIPPLPGDPHAGHDGPDGDLPDGAEAFVTGPRIRGTVVDGADVSPLGGFTVVEHGVPSPAPPQLTAADGVFLVDLRNSEGPALSVRADGWVPTIMLTSNEGRLYFQGEYKIEMFRVADEEAATLEELGRPRAASLGRVVINFQPLGSAGGVRAELKAPGVKGYHYDADDALVAGAGFGEDPFAGEVVFPEVPPGRWPIVVTEPEGLDCRGPSEVPSEAGTYTRAYFYCRPRADWAEAAAPGGP